MAPVYLSIFKKKQGERERIEIESHLLPSPLKLLPLSTCVAAVGGRGWMVQFFIQLWIEYGTYVSSWNGSATNGASPPEVSRSTLFNLLGKMPNNMRRCQRRNRQGAALVQWPIEPNRTVPSEERTDRVRRKRLGSVCFGEVKNNVLVSRHFVRNALWSLDLGPGVDFLNIKRLVCSVDRTKTKY